MHERFDVARGHLGIAVHAGTIGKSRSLTTTRRNDTRTDGGRTLAGGSRGEFAHRNRHDFDLQVDAIEQGAADATHVALHLSRTTGTRVVRIVVIPTGTGVHGGNEHERAGERDVVTGTRNADLAVFERLAEGFERVFGVFRKFVEKEHAVVRQTDLAGLKMCTAADEGDVGNGVVGRTKRACGDEGVAASEFTGHGMDLRGLQTFGQTEGWQNRGEAFRHHALATAGTAHK